MIASNLVHPQQGIAPKTISSSRTCWCVYTRHGNHLMLLAACLISDTIREVAYGVTCSSVLTLLISRDKSTAEVRIVLCYTAYGVGCSRSWIHALAHTFDGLVTETQRHHEAVWARSFADLTSEETASSHLRRQCLLLHPLRCRRMLQHLGLDRRRLV